MSIILSHTRDTLPTYPSLSHRLLAHDTYICFNKHFVSRLIGPWLIFIQIFYLSPPTSRSPPGLSSPSAFFVFVHRHHTRIHLFSSRFVSLSLSSLFFSLFFSLSFSPSTRSVSTSPHLRICDLQRVRTESRIWLLR